MEEKIIALLQQINDELKTLNTRLALTEPSDDQTMLPAEAAQYLHVSYDTVLRWAREGKVPSVQPGGQRVLFRKKALDEYLRDQENQRVPNKTKPSENTSRIRKIIA